MPHRTISRKNRSLAASMRKRMGEAELRLWLRLRKPGLNRLRFRRQAPIGPYIVDFFCPLHRLVVEVDGGGHAMYSAAKRDRVRDAWLKSRGLTIVRVWTSDVNADLE